MAHLFLATQRQDNRTGLTENLTKSYLEAKIVA